MGLVVAHQRRKPADAPPLGSWKTGERSAGQRGGTLDAQDDSRAFEERRLGHHRESSQIFLVCLARTAEVGITLRILLGLRGPVHVRVGIASGLQAGSSGKPTYFLTNVPGLRSLEVRCVGAHVRTTLLGSTACWGKHRLRSTLAGCYPKKLCKKIAYLATRESQLHGGGPSRRR